VHRDTDIDLHTKNVLQVINGFPSSARRLPQQPANRRRRARTAEVTRINLGAANFLPFQMSKDRLGLVYKGITLKKGNWRKRISSIQGWVFFLHDIKQSQPFSYHFDTPVLQKPCFISHYWPLTDCRCCMVSFTLLFKSREQAFFQFLSYFSSISRRPSQQYRDEEWDPFSGAYFCKTRLATEKESRVLTCHLSILSKPSEVKHKFHGCCLTALAGEKKKKTGIAKNPHSHLAKADMRKRCDPSTAGPSPCQADSIRDCQTPSWRRCSAKATQSPAPLTAVPHSSGIGHDPR